MKRYLLKNFPGLLTLKAWFVGFIHSISPTRRSYSQGGEDVIIEELIDKTKPSEAIFIDIGANHPSRLSNSYKLYRKGFSGIVIEPNRSLLQMHRVFRPRDLHLDFGCGSQFDLLEFQEAKSHVLSGFKNPDLKTADIKKVSFVPVIPLDQIARFFQKSICLLSIDVEGLDFEVLQGAEQTLSRVLYVIIEAEKNEKKIEAYMFKRNFTIRAKTKHNVVFVNQNKELFTRA